MIASSRAGEALADRRLKESENASTVFSWTPLAVVCSSTYASVLMPRETASERAARTRKIIGGLSRAYPDAHCELNFSSPLELLVATILSAQCTDKRVNLVTADLFRKYRTAEDYARARPAELEQAIKTAGFYRNKARSLQACCRALLEKHRGEVPRTMEALVELGGVGRKTANVVLGNAFGVNAGLVVDTHVTRLAQRLGLTRATDPARIEPDLMELVPQEQWTLFSHLLIWHGRRRCAARNPDCTHCEIQSLCPQVGVAKPRTRQARRRE
jgi:endonuclease-3